MRSIALGVAGIVMLVSSATGQTRPAPRLAIGPSLIAAGSNQGSGVHLSAVIPTGVRILGLDLTAQVSGLRGNTSASPFSCVMVQTTYCLGRSEQLKVGAATVGVEGRARLLGVPTHARLDVGAYAEHLAASEHQGPTTLCYEGGQLVSCADNPPFQRYANASSSVGPGWAFAWGFQPRVARMNLSLEAALHGYRAHRRDTALLLLAFGVSF